MTAKVPSSPDNTELDVEVHIEDEIATVQQAMEKQRFSWGQALMLREQTLRSPMCLHKTDLYDELVQERREAFQQARQKYQALLEGHKNLAIR